MRRLTRDGVQWRIEEQASRATPGSRGARSLIFDGDSIMRRFWEYPANWRELSDDALGALVQSAPLPARRWMPPHAAREPARPDEIATAHECTERTRALLTELSLLRNANAALRADRSTILTECRRQREAMRLAIELYASALRSSGVPPERALVQLKQAIHHGIAMLPSADEQETDDIVRDGVAWAIEAYYAA